MKLNFPLWLNTAMVFSTVSSDATLTMYRESSNSSLVTLLCMTSDRYTHALWSWTPLSTAKDVQVVTTAMYGSNDTFNERFSYGDFNGHYFPLYFSPVKFEDCGRFNCYFENLLVASINVVTLKGEHYHFKYPRCIFQNNQFYLYLRKQMTDPQWSPDFHFSLCSAA